jgi:S1-C subfamily serine protease
VITAVNGEALVSNSDLPRIISLLDPGDVVTLDIVRDGDEQQIDIELGERPDQVQR